MVIENITNGKIMATDAQIASTFFVRLKGLLGTRQFEAGKGLIIRPCNSVHTVGMKYAIDILFMDGFDQILKIVSDMPASRFALSRKSSYVIELPAGTIAFTGTTVGDKLAISENLQEN